MKLTKQQKLMVAVMVLASFVVVLNQTIVNPAIPSVMRTMSVSAATAQWLITAFTLVNAIMIPIAAYLSDRFSTRGLYVFSMGAFVVGSLLAAWSPTFSTLLAGRVVQAIGAGIIMPLVMTVMMLTFPVEQRGTAMGFFGIVIAFAPAIGPTVGGMVIDASDFHIMFWVVTILAIILLLGAGWVTTKTAGQREDPKLDVLSVVLSTVGFGGLLYGFSMLSSGAVKWWDIVITVVGLASIVWFVIRQLHLETPLLQVRVLKVRNFNISVIIGMLVQAALMGAVVLLPIYIQSMRGLSATTSGLIILPGAILTGLMGPFTGRYFDRHGARHMVLLGTALLAIGTGALIFLNDSTSTTWITFIYMVRMFGLTLINMPINTWGINSLDNRVINHGNSVSNTLRMVAGSFGTAILVSVMGSVASHQTTMDATHASIRGVQIAFVVATIFAVATVILALLFVRDGAPATKLTAKEAKAARADEEPVQATPIPDEALKHDVFSVPADASVAEAVRALAAHHVSSMPILSKEGKPIGVISEGHVVRALGDRNQTFYDPVNAIASSGLERVDFRDKLRTVMHMTVRELGSNSITTLPEDTSLERASRVLGSNRLKKLYLVDPEGHLSAVLNRSDLLKYVLSVAEHASAEEDSDTRGTDA